MDSTYGKLFLRSFSFFFRQTFIVIVSLITHGGDLFTKKIKAQNAIETTGKKSYKCMFCSLTVDSFLGPAVIEV